MKVVLLDFVDEIYNSGRNLIFSIILFISQCIYLAVCDNCFVLLDNLIKNTQFITKD